MMTFHTASTHRSERLLRVVLFLVIVDVAPKTCLRHRGRWHPVGRERTIKSFQLRLRVAFDALQGTVAFNDARPWFTPPVAASQVAVKQNHGYAGDADYERSAEPPEQASHAGPGFGGLHRRHEDLQRQMRNAGAFCRPRKVRRRVAGRERKSAPDQPTQVI